MGERLSLLTTSKGEVQKVLKRTLIPHPHHHPIRGVGCGEGEESLESEVRKLTHRDIDVDRWPISGPWHLHRRGAPE